MKHSVINQSGPSQDAFKVAFLLSIQEALRNKVKDIVLLVPLKSTLEHGPIEKFLGREAIKTLLKGQPVSSGATIGISIYARSLKTLDSPPSVILSAYIPSKELEIVLKRYPNVAAVIYLPWMDAEIEEWKKLKKPELIDVSEFLKRLDQAKAQ